MSYSAIILEFHWFQCCFIGVKPGNKVNKQDFLQVFQGSGIGKIFTAAPLYAKSNVGLQKVQNTLAALSAILLQATMELRSGMKNWDGLDTSERLVCDPCWRNGPADQRVEAR